MATFNLVRNSRVFFTTNVNAAGKVGRNDADNADVAFTAANSQEIQVLDGFSFSQGTNADTITISEAGDMPTRGQRSFNTSLNNVEFSFSTYMRPRFATPNVKAEESHLWNALLGSDNIATAEITSAGAFTYNAGVLTLTGTGYTYKVGEVYTVKGVVGLGASQFNTAVKVTSASATVVNLTYLITPTAAYVAGNFVIGTVKFSKTAWNEYPAITADVGGIITAYSEATSALSNKNQLVKFGMVMTIDGVTYVIDNCALDQAVIDFGLDGIAMVAWTGKGTALRQLSSNIVYTGAATPVLSIGATGTITGKNTTAGFITNKLSTVTLKSNIGGVAGTAYTLALTGGSITIANNISYITPAVIGVVNSPIAYYTGARSITGSLTAYLRTGTNNTADLLNTMLNNASTSVDPKFKLQVEIGGVAATTRIEVQMDGAMLQIPTVDAQAVMSTTINFTAQGSDSAQSATAGYDIENTNDLEIRYFAA